MNVLVTGAFQVNSEELVELEAVGHEVFLHPDERTPVEQPERYEAVVCNSLFLYNPIERFTNLRLSPLPSPRLNLLPSPRLSPLPSPRLSPLPSPRLSPLPSPRLNPLPSPRLSPLPSPRLRSRTAL